MVTTSTYLSFDVVKLLKCLENCSKNTLESRGARASRIFASAAEDSNLSFETATPTL